MSVHPISQEFFSSFQQAQAWFDVADAEEAARLEREVQQIRSTPIATRAEALQTLDQLSETLRDSCSTIQDVVMPIIDQERKRLDTSAGSSGKRLVPDDFRVRALRLPEKRHRTGEVTEAESIITVLNTDLVGGLQLLDKEVPYWSAPTDGYSLPQNLSEEISTQQALLVSALKAHRCALRTLGHADLEPLVQHKSQIARCLDAQRIKEKGVAPHPQEEPFLTLTTDLSGRWPRTKTAPIREVPAYLYLYPHATDSGEENNRALIGSELHCKAGAPWTETLKFVEAHVLSRPLSTHSPQELQDLLCTLHSHIVAHPSSIRVHEVLVFGPGEKGSLEEHARSLEPSEPQISKMLGEIEAIATRWGSTEAGRPYYTPEHWNAFRRLGYVPPAPETLPRLMKQFFEQLVLLLNNDALHPYQVAAFIHHGLTKIHPFDDANGRTARLLTNIYLMQKGIRPFFPYSDRQYSKIACLPPERYQEVFGDFIHGELTRISGDLERRLLPTERHESAWHTIEGCPVQ
jgi:hypothetical protein